VNHALEASLLFAGVEPDSRQEAQLDLLADWLTAEAVVAGGVGPGESTRIYSRHLADAAIYASVWDTPPNRAWDLGTGVGLPGLVLAILWPRCRVTLIDRSQRRIDLTRRAARIVEVDVDAEVASIESLGGSMEAIVSRAAMPPARMRPYLQRLLAPGGVAVVSGSGSRVAGYEEVMVPEGILDHDPKLLMMRGL
jgi:16S rRNA (guanine527-N7)-methyltransferase